MTDHGHSHAYAHGGSLHETTIARAVARDRVFTDAVRLARSIAGTSMAAITLVDDTNLWFLATSGFEVRRVAKVGTFCEQTVAAGTRLIVEDAINDPTFADASFVTSGPMMRYYAGIPMTSHDRRMVGTLCVADQRPNLALGDECFRHLALVLEITTDRLEHHRRELAVAESISKVRELPHAIGSEAVSLSTDSARLASTARAHELATDAAIQGVRQVILLDREIHDALAGVPVRNGLASSDPGIAARMRSHFQLHNAISLAVEDEVDALIGSAATLRMRSGTLEMQGQRIADLSAVLDDILSNKNLPKADM